MHDFLVAIKKAAVDAVKATKPVEIVYGIVTSVSPLKISIEQKMSLSDKQLILTRSVTDYETNVTVDWVTETAESHTHKVKGKKVITVHNGLVVGNKVILLRQQGGQKYVVLDKVGT